MNRKDFYMKQKVTEGELDNSFDYVEDAIDRVYEDQGTIGVVSGAVVSEHSPTPNMTIDLVAGIVINQLGERIKWTTTLNIDCSIDEDGVPTTVGTPGNSKYLSIFAEFTRTLSDPRIDGNQQTVYFERSESYDINVVQGAEAVSPSPPTLRSDQILLADILIEYGDTQIFNSDIDTSRREWAITASSASVTIGCGQIDDALQDIVDAIETSDTGLSDHKASTSNEHNASAVNYAGGPNWHDVSSNPSTDVESQLDKIIIDLSTTTGNGGSDKIGSGSRTVGTVDLSSGSIYDQLGEIATYLNSLLSVNARLIRARNLVKVTNVMNSGFNIKHLTFYDDTTVDYVAVGNSGSAADAPRISMNGLGDWQDAADTFVSSPTTMHCIEYNYNEGTMVAVGGKGATGATLQVHTNPRMTGGTWVEKSVTGTNNTGDHGRCILGDTENGYCIVGYKQGTPGTGNVLARSNAPNGGSWSIPSYSGNPAAIYDIEVSRNVSGTPQGTIIAVGADTSGNGLIFRSINDGSSWSVVTPSGPPAVFYSVDYDVTNDLWWVAGLGGFYYSDDDGLTWDEITSTFGATGSCGIAVDEDGTILVVGYTSGSSVRSFVSIDGSSFKNFSLGLDLEWNAWSKLSFLRAHGTIKGHPDRFVLIPGGGGRDAYMSLDLNGIENV